MKTLIHGGDVVAYADGGHRLLRGGALVFDGDRVTFVGRSFAGPVDQRIDATGKLVIPGFVNIHCHADTEAGGRLIADVGRRDYFHTGFLNYYGARKGAKSLGPRQDPEIGGRFAMAEMLRNGCTTVVDIGVAAESHCRFHRAVAFPAEPSMLWSDSACDWATIVSMPAASAAAATVSFFMIVQFSIAARNEDSVAGHCKVGKIDANSPGFRQRLQPRCDVNPIAVDRAILARDHIAHVEPDAKEHSPVICQLAVAASEILLYLHRTFDGFHRAIHMLWTMLWTKSVGVER